MKCPIDNADLAMSERSGVEIDYCPQCRGVWLDRGELDKIIERSAPAAGPEPVGRDASRDGRDARHDRYGHDHGRQPYRKKKESFLSEIFDF